MTNLDSILKSRDITLLTKVCIVKGIIFPVVKYGYESWTIKKAEHQRTDAFKLWRWRRLLRVPLDSKEIKAVSPKGNQPWIFIGRTDDEAEAPILWPHDGKNRITDARKNLRQKRRVAEDEMIRQHHLSMDMNLSGFWEIVKDRWAWCAAVHGTQRVGHNLASEQQQLEHLLLLLADISLFIICFPTRTWDP